MASRSRYYSAYDSRYPFYSLSTYIPDWLHEPLQIALAKHDLTKQEVVIAALTSFLQVKPPSGRLRRAEKGERILREIFGEICQEGNSVVPPQGPDGPAEGKGPILVK